MDTNSERFNKWFGDGRPEEVVTGEVILTSTHPGEFNEVEVEFVDENTGAIRTTASSQVLNILPLGFIAADKEVPDSGYDDDGVWR